VAVVMRVRNGEIVSSRDYHDHLASARARGRLGELFAAVSAQDAAAGGVAAGDGAGGGADEAGGGSASGSASGAR